MTGSDVQIDRRKNQGMGIYFAVLGLVGVVILIFTGLRGWGFWGWFGGGLLVFTAVASVASMAKTGGAGLASCPRCGHANPVLHVTMHRYLCCAGCQTWLEGSTTSQVVPDDHVASYPAFRLELPRELPTFLWPAGCPVCGGAVTRTRAIEGTDVVGDAFAMVAPVAIQKVTKLEVPCCDQHDDGIAVHREGGTPILSFRSLGYWQRFKAANGIESRATSG